MISSTNNMRKVLGPKLAVLLVVSALLSYSLRQQWKSVNTNTRAVEDSTDVVPGRDEGSHVTKGEEDFETEAASYDDDGDNDDVHDYSVNDNDFIEDGVNLFQVKDDTFENNKDIVDNDDDTGDNEIIDENTDDEDDKEEEYSYTKMDAFTDDETTNNVNNIKDLSENNKVLLSPQEYNKGIEHKDGVRLDVPEGFPNFSDDNDIDIQNEHGANVVENELTDLQESVKGTGSVEVTEGEINDEIKSELPWTGNIPNSNIEGTKNSDLSDYLLKQSLMMRYVFKNPVERNQITNIGQNIQQNNQILPFLNSVGDVDRKRPYENNVLNDLVSNQKGEMDTNSVNRGTESNVVKGDTVDVPGGSYSISEDEKSVGEDEENFNTRNEQTGLFQLVNSTSASNNRNDSVLGENEANSMIGMDKKTNSLGFGDGDVISTEKILQSLNDAMVRIQNEIDAQNQLYTLNQKINAAQEPNDISSNSTGMIREGIDDAVPIQPNPPAQILTPHFEALNSVPQPAFNQFKDEINIDSNTGEISQTINNNNDGYPVFESPGFDDFRGFDIKYGVDKINLETDRNTFLGLKSDQTLARFEENENSRSGNDLDQAETNVIRNTDGNTMSEQLIVKIIELDDDNDDADEDDDGDDKQLSIEQQNSQPSTLLKYGDRRNNTQLSLGSKENKKPYTPFENVETSYNQQNAPENITDFIIISEQENNTAPSLTFKRETVVSLTDEDATRERNGGQEAEAAGNVVGKSPGYFSRSLLSVLLDRWDGFDVNGQEDGGDDNEDDGLEGGGGGLDDNGDREKDTYTYRLFPGEDNNGDKDNMNPTQDESTGYTGGNYEHPDYDYDRKGMENVEGQLVIQSQNENVINDNNYNLKNRFYDHQDDDDNNKDNNDNDNNIIISNGAVDVGTNDRQTTTPNNNGGSYDNPRPLTDEEYNALHTQPYHQGPTTADNRISQIKEDYNGLENTQYENQPLIETNILQRLKNEKLNQWGEDSVNSDDNTFIDQGKRPFLSDASDLNRIPSDEDQSDATLPRFSGCPVNLELSPVRHDVTALAVFPGALADWLTNAIEQISGEPSDSTYNVLASLKRGDTSAFFQMPRRSVICTHSAKSTEFDRAILIVNNPLAVEEKHLRFLPFAFEWRRYFLWDTTIISWLSSDLPLLVMTTDDLIADPETHLRKIASFLGISDDRVDASLTCALERKPPILIDDVTKISGVYSRERQRLSRSIDKVIEVASREAPDILYRLFQYRTVLYL